MVLLMIKALDLNLFIRFKKKDFEKITKEELHSIFNKMSSGEFKKKVEVFIMELGIFSERCFIKLS